MWRTAGIGDVEIKLMSLGGGLVMRGRKLATNSMQSSVNVKK
jgi:hypothetical protein